MKKLVQLNEHFIIETAYGFYQAVILGAGENHPTLVIVKEFKET